jgi:REP element-mobilizing transposase RayT
MPRSARSSVGGYCYHVLNRGNGRATVFHKPQDYQAFVALIAEAGLRHPIRLIAYCVMPNHFHLALWPVDDGDLSRWMHWLLTECESIRTSIRRNRPLGTAAWVRRTAEKLGLESSLRAPGRPPGTMEYGGKHPRSPEL